VLAPVLDQYAVGFRVMHGFASATVVHDAAEDDDGRDLIVLYVGDRSPVTSPSTMQDDLTSLLTGARRIKPTSTRCRSARQLNPRADDPLSDAEILFKGPGPPQSFPATDKQKDKRYKWFTSSYGNRCWELDAMDPNDLRDCVEAEIQELIEPTAWQRCAMVNKAEQESLRDILKGWRGRP
jgi:hypothetical protein